jgi:carbonic anhydrase
MCQPGDALLHAAVEANVRRTVHEILQTPEAKIREAAREVMLVGAIYEMESGRVRFLD